MYSDHPSFNSEQIITNFLEDFSKIYPKMINDCLNSRFKQMEFEAEVCLLIEKHFKLIYVFSEFLTWLQVDKTLFLRETIGTYSWNDAWPKYKRTVGVINIINRIIAVSWQNLTEKEKPCV